MKAAEIIDEITRAGGRIWLEQDKVRAHLPEPLRPLVDVIHAHKAELLAYFTRRDDARLDDLRPVFVRWFDSRIWLDVVRVARREPPRCWTSVTTLHADFCAWLFDSKLAPASRAQFHHLLSQLCLEVRLIQGEELVANVAMRKTWRMNGVSANRQKLTSQQVSNIRRRP